MTSIEQLETLRNAELYDDCKNLVILSRWTVLIFIFSSLGRISPDIG